MGIEQRNLFSIFSTWYILTYGSIHQFVFESLLLARWQPEFHSSSQEVWRIAQNHSGATLCNVLAEWLQFSDAASVEPNRALCGLSDLSDEHPLCSPKAAEPRHGNDSGWLPSKLYYHLHLAY